MWRRESTGSEYKKLAGLLFLSLFVFLFFIHLSAAIEVLIVISEKIDGSLAHVSVSNAYVGAPTRVLMDWENIGSAGCVVTLSADVYEKKAIQTKKLVNGTIVVEKTFNISKDPVDVLWSFPTPLEPGDHSPLEFIWIPKSAGEFVLKPKAYMCFKTIELEDINVSVRKRNISVEQVPALIETKSTPSSIEFSITPEEDTGPLTIVPQVYPVGWIVESKTIPFPGVGNVTSVAIRYAPQIWRETDIVFDIISEDGRYRSQWTANIRSPEEPGWFEKNKETVFICLIIVLVLINMAQPLVRRKTHKKVIAYANKTAHRILDVLISIDKKLKPNRKRYIEERREKEEKEKK